VKQFTLSLLGSGLLLSVGVVVRIVVVDLVVVVVDVVGTGHLCLLQDLVSNGEPLHLLPPFLAICATFRLLVWVPVLHEAVHGDQSP